MFNDSGIVLNKVDNALLATIQATLTPEVLAQFKRSLLKKLAQSNIKFVLCDLSVVDIIDIEEFSCLSDIFSMAELMGTQTILVGISPGVAATIVDYEVDISKFKYALNVDDGLALAR